MVVDNNSRALDPVRQTLSLALYPVQLIASAPVDLYRWSDDITTTNTTLRDENATLKTQNLLLTAQLQRFTSLQAENMRMRHLLQSSRKVSDQLLIGETLSIDLDPFKHLIVVNKGARQEVYNGQPVLDAHGMMGQVFKVGLLSSQIILLTDPDHAIPVQVNRNGERAIAYGDGSNLLSLPYLPNNVDMEVGDLLVTSGLGGRFPAGYPVAKVTSITRDPGQPFASIKAEPTAKLSQAREVLMVVSGTSDLTFSPEESETTDVKQESNETEAEPETSEEANNGAQ